jgi:preprotein translocase subunit SecG
MMVMVMVMVAVIVVVMVSKVKGQRADRPCIPS